MGYPLRFVTNSLPFRVNTGMTYKIIDFKDLMSQMDDQERFDIFSDMVSLVLSGDWGARMNHDGVFPGDPEFDDLVNKYLRAIQRRNHADGYLRMPR